MDDNPFRSAPAASQDDNPFRLNVPTGEMRSAPPVPASSGRVVDDPERGAGFWTTARASLAPDVNDQIKRFAAARFPDMPVEEAVKRYGILDGQIVFSDPKSGQVVREVSSLVGAINPVDAFNRLGRQVASQAGPTIPAVTGALGGAMGSGGGSIPLAAVGGAVGDTGRQMLDRWLAGESLTDIDWGNVAGQAALQGGGQAVGLGVAKGIEYVGGKRNPLGASITDRLKINDPAAMSKWAELQDEAKSRGVQLTIADLTDLPSLQTKLRQLRRYPETMNRVEGFLRERALVQVPGAVNQELDRLAPRTPIDEAITGFTGAADDVLNAASAKRSAAASPHYQRAYASGVEPDASPILGEIEAKLQKLSPTSGSAKALVAARESLTKSVDDATGKITPLSDYEALHSAKESLDATIDKLITRGEIAPSEKRRALREIVSIKSQLNDTLRNAHPGYAEGQDIYKAMSPDVTEVLKSGVRGIQKRAASENMTVLNSVLNESEGLSPFRVARLRDLYKQAGKEEEWNVGLRAWLTDKLDDALKINSNGQPGNVAGKFQTTIWGHPNQRAVVTAALGDPGRVASFEKLMSVLDAASRAYPVGSQTATDLAAPGMVETGGKVAKSLAFATSPGQWLNTGQVVSDAISAARTPAMRERLAEAMLNPNGMAILDKMKTLSPTSRRFSELLGDLMVVAGVPQFLGRPSDRAPQIGGSAPN